MKIRERVVNGVLLNDAKAAPADGISQILLQANAEGYVLLKNEDVLPLKKGESVSVFGRMQADYYKSGTGSGGLVNVKYKTNIYDSLLASDHITVNKSLASLYNKWIDAHPFDTGDGWVEPWAQEEMPLTDEIVKEAADVSTVAIVVIARTAGEDRDNTENEGSWLLTKAEETMLEKVSAYFDKVCVLLNVGNIIDMKWVEKYNIDSVLYVWQGGQDGGTAVSDVLCGKRYPSGKLSDTIAYDIKDYISYKNFGDYVENTYEEDIFVGYRYFETFARDKVMYPFGFGMGYTKFSVTFDGITINERTAELQATVRNIGDFPGKEVLQVYYSVKDGVLSRPARELIAFKKTDEIAPGMSQAVKILFDLDDMAAYDDNGKTGNKACYVMERGIYNIYLGTDVRTAEKIYENRVSETVVIKRVKNLFAPNKEIKRLVNDNGTMAYEMVVSDMKPEIEETVAIKQTGDRGIKLKDVYDKKEKIEDFIAQLSIYDLACLSQGEGMNSPKVRPGTGGAIGGVTKELLNFGIPVICVTDGPSGLRYDNGDAATSLPNGTLLACTWNYEITELLYSYVGMEAYAYKTDALLGPGINIHRMPLCGRHFEYLSEDPYLTGIIGKAMCSGLSKCGVTATVKHFATNNQETKRGVVNTLISERALREIYLKPFKMILDDKKTTMLMTAYNRLNGTYCASHYALNTALLRDEWGFEGLVMSDWFTKTHMNNDEPCEDREYPIIAQNDVYMVNNNATVVADSILKSVENNKITIGQLQRNAMNICKVIMTTPTFERYIHGEDTGGMGELDVSKMTLCECFDNIELNEAYYVNVDKTDNYAIKINYKSDKPELMQITVRVLVNGMFLAAFVINGTDGVIKDDVLAAFLLKGENKLEFDFVEENITINKIELYKK